MRKGGVGSSNEVVQASFSSNGCPTTDCGSRQPAMAPCSSRCCCCCICHGMGRLPCRLQMLPGRRCNCFLLKHCRSLFSHTYRNLSDMAYACSPAVPFILPLQLCLRQQRALWLPSIRLERPGSQSAALLRPRSSRWHSRPIFRRHLHLRLLQRP